MFHTVDDRTLVPAPDNTAVSTMNWLTVIIQYLGLNTHVLGLFIGAFNDDVLRTTAFNPRHWESCPSFCGLLLQICPGDDVRKGSVHRVQLRDILES